LTIQPCVLSATVNGKAMIIVLYKNAVSGLNDTGIQRLGITNARSLQLVQRRVRFSL